MNSIVGIAILIVNFIIAVNPKNSLEPDVVTNDTTSQLKNSDDSHYDLLSNKLDKLDQDFKDFNQNNDTDYIKHTLVKKSDLDLLTDMKEREIDWKEAENLKKTGESQKKHLEELTKLNNEMIDDEIFKEKQDELDNQELINHEIVEEQDKLNELDDKMHKEERTHKLKNAELEQKVDELESLATDELYDEESKDEDKIIDKMIGKTKSGLNEVTEVENNIVESEKKNIKEQTVADQEEEDDCPPGTISVKKLGTEAYAAYQKRKEKHSDNKYTDHSSEHNQLPICPEALENGPCPCIAEYFEPPLENATLSEETTLPELSKPHEDEKENCEEFLDRLNKNYGDELQDLTDEKLQNLAKKHLRKGNKVYTKEISV